MFRPPVVLAAVLLAGFLASGCRKGVEEQLAAAQAQQDDSQFQESIEPLRSILGEQPDNAEANYLLGVALVRTGRLAPAVWPLRKASESEEYAEKAGQLLTFVLANTRNFDEAIASANRLLERKPDSAEAMRLRAQAQLGARHVDLALADADRLLVLAPDDVVGVQTRAAALFELERWAEAEAAYAQLQEVVTDAGDLATAGRACIARAGSLEKQPNLARAEEMFASCEEAFPTDPGVTSALAAFRARQGQPDEAEAVWRKAVERAPESLQLRLGLGNQLYAAGKPAGAIEVLTQAAADFSSPQAWEALAELYRREGDFSGAEQALAKAQASGGESERLRFKRADLLIDAGNPEEAEKLAGEFQNSSYRDFIRGRLLLQRGDPAGALEALDAGIVAWPDNAPARAMAGRAAQELGQYERAFEEYRQAMRIDLRGTEAGYAAAHLAHSLGRPSLALEYARQHVVTHPYTDAAPYVIGIEAAEELGQEQIAAQLRKALEIQGKGQASATVALAQLAQKRAGPEAAIKVVDGSGLDLMAPGNEPALRAKVDAEVQLGRAAPALAQVEKALAQHPDAPALLDLRGRVLAGLGRTDDARASFEQALAKDPAFAPSLAALGSLAVTAGDLAAARDYFDRAVAADPSDSESAYRAAQVTLAQGQKEEGEKRLRAVLARAPGHPGACNDLAWTLAEAGRDLDLALDLAQRAARVSAGNGVDFEDTLAYVQMKRGEPAAAAETLEKALAKHPDSGTLRYRLGLVRAEQGDREAALQAFREALQDQSFTNADGARAEIARLEGGSAR